MVRRPTRSRALQPTEQMTQDAMRQGIARLTKRLDEVRAFDPATVTKQNEIPQVEALAASVDEALVRTFGADTLDYKRYSDAAYFDNGPHNFAFSVPIDAVQASLNRSKQNSIALLSQAISSLEERLAEHASFQRVDTVESPRTFERKVFIVHGHEDGAREAVARFLERLGFEAIILHEQANQGRTVIEKVEAHGDVGFAVVLLSPDDEGNLKGQHPQPRARQNVLLELGYFIGKLTRRRVCTLRVGEVEIPSDWRGVIDEPFDAGGAWRQTLARELEAAEFEIDWNKVMRS
jgi:predicted nucleotide-binding protein